MTLISPISTDRQFSRDLLDARGGFVWWYLDLVNDDGDGLVSIWSYGLPFLPGYASSSRSGSPQRVGDRPSLNLAVYRAGVPVFYTLQEFEPDHVAWGDDRIFQFGDNSLQIDLKTGRADARFDLPIAGSDDRLRGDVSIRGSAPTIETDSADSGTVDDHLWGPLLTPATGDVDLRWQHTECTFSGDAYVDRNASAKPLHELGFEKWTWGRARVGDVEKVYYVLWPDDGGAPTAIGFEFGETVSRRVELDVTFFAPETGFAGMPWFRSFKLFENGRVWLEGSTQSVVDNGPFYIRGQFFCVGGSVGVFEWCEPRRIDLARHRFLVKMRVQNPRRNSIWLPLFAGPSNDRVNRLLRSWFRA